MKKIFTNSILTALLLLLLMPLFGQKHTYVPLAVEGAHWWVSFLNDNNPPWEPDDYFQYVIRGDSIINDIIYKKVFYRGTALLLGSMLGRQQHGSWGDFKSGSGGFGGFGGGGGGGFGGFGGGSFGGGGASGSW